MGMQSSKSSQKSEPWKAQQPYLKEVFGEAQNQYQNATPLQGAEGLRQDMFDHARSRAGLPSSRSQSGKGTQSPNGQGFTGSPVEQAYGQFLGNSLAGPGSYNPYTRTVSGRPKARTLLSRG